MLDDKQKKESEIVIKQLIKENKIIKPMSISKQFFLNKAIISLRTAKKLFEISEDKNENLDAYMWTINISYYSMFYAATALLAHYNHKIDRKSVV